jgi:hypothetical protein
MAFAPDAFVIRNWLDDVIISPWVSLASTPNAVGTILQFRRFPGNLFSTSRIVQNWSVRGKTMVDAQECITGWGHAFQWNSLSFFGWLTLSADMTADFDPTSTDIQIRHRTSDWQWLVGVPPPSPFIPGPGPFMDRTRIGRQILTGPAIDEGIDSRSQAQDAFPTEIDPTISSGTGEHFRPTTDRFGSAAFSQGSELGINNTSPNLITGDSIWIEVQDVRLAGGILSVDWYGAIVSGPHVGKAPPPWTVGANGFFQVPADSVRNASGAVVDGFWFVDLNDFYFRGGDVVHYVWLATDAQAGVMSNPVGLNNVPASIEEAQAATRGMFEVSFLPAISWDAGYLARIQADDHGDLEPTAEELAASAQASCLLYTQQSNTRRRTGDTNRTSFMYTLDRLGYRGSYDVYDHQGLGNTNNQLGGRATVQQAEGYNLIVYDTGNQGPNEWLMPDGSDFDVQKIDQAGWFRNWLQQASVGEAGFATLWVIGSNALEERPDNLLYSTDMAAVLSGTTQQQSSNPDVVGQSLFTFVQNGTFTCDADFSNDALGLEGGCPVFRDYDALGSSGSGVETHVYADPRFGGTGAAAIVMNSNPEESWNTILQSFPWFDIRRSFDSAPLQPAPGVDLLDKVLTCALPLQCQQPLDPSDTPEDSPGIQTPAVMTALFQNVPNPFNPTTQIRFDLARDAHVQLRIYDVAGRLVRTLVDEKRAAGGEQIVVWNGLDDAGERVSSGVYFYRLETGDYTATRKLVVMK